MPFAPMSKIQQEQMQEQQGQGPVNISGGQGAKFDVVPGQEKKQASSGQYANLQNYLKANQPQAAQMGQKVTQSVEQKGQEAQQKLGQFEQQKPSVAAYDPNVAIQNAPTLEQQQKEEFRNIRQTGGYTGPQQLEQVQGYKETQQAAQQASEAAKMAGTETGQQQLLRRTFERPNYTQGETKLDQVLLMGNQGAKQNLSNLSQKYSDLYNVFNQKAQDVGAGVNQATQQALANRQAIEAAIPKAWQDLMNPLEAKAAERAARNTQDISDVTRDLQDDLLLEQTLQRLGLQEGQKLYNFDLMSYLNPNFTIPGVNDVATAEERTRYQALADLFQDPTRTQLGGEARNIDPYSFDRDKFMKDIAASEQGFQQELSKPLAIHPDLERFFGGPQTTGQLLERLPQLEEMLNTRLAYYGDTNDLWTGVPQLKYTVDRVRQQKNALDSVYKYNRVIGREV